MRRQLLRENGVEAQNRTFNRRPEPQLEGMVVPSDAHVTVVEAD
ncbi:MAG: hypothetical protein P8Y36_14275 [Alphaproteobacteria bacterium]